MVNDIVPRKQMAAFIIRAKYGETFTYTETPYYTDVPSTSVFFKYVQKLKDDAITTTTGEYMAKSYVTRDQKAAFLGRTFLWTGDISMITPYKSSSDIANIGEAFSSTYSAPWGFAHSGINFFPNGNLKPFQAVSSGSVDLVELSQNDLTSNWQVNIHITYNDTYSIDYVFEPMSKIQSDGNTQRANILVSTG